MKKILVMVAVVAMALVVGSGSVLAADSMFGPFKVGAEVGFSTSGSRNYAGNSAFGLGPRAEFDMKDIIGLPISAEASFDWFFLSGDSGYSVTMFETNLNALYALPLPIPEMFGVYAGAGLNVTHFKVSNDNVNFSDSTNDAHLNIIAGSKFNLGMMFTPFVETKFELGSYNRFALMGGVLF